jgi:hypothetical protein
LSPADGFNSRWQAHSRSKHLRQYLGHPGLAVGVAAFLLDVIDQEEAELANWNADLTEIKTLSCTAYEVTETAKINDAAAITVICLNCVLPSVDPKTFNMLTAPTA